MKTSEGPDLAFVFQRKTAFQAASKRSAIKQIVVCKNIIEIFPEHQYLRAKALIYRGENMAITGFLRKPVGIVMNSRNSLPQAASRSLAPASAVD